MYEKIQISMKATDLKHIRMIWLSIVPSIPASAQKDIRPSSQGSKLWVVVYIYGLSSSWRGRDSIKDLSQSRSSALDSLSLPVIKNNNRRIEIGSVGDGTNHEGQAAVLRLKGTKVHNNVGRT